MDTEETERVVAPTPLKVKKNSYLEIENLHLFDLESLLELLFIIQDRIACIKEEINGQENNQVG